MKQIKRKFISGICIGVIFWLAFSFLRNPMWPFDYAQCLQIKQIVKKSDVSAVIAWVNNAKEQQYDFFPLGYFNAEIDWYKSTDEELEPLDTGRLIVSFVDFDTKLFPRSWEGVDLVGLSVSPDHYAVIRYNSEVDLAEYSSDKRFKILNNDVAVFCGSRFLDGP